MCLWHSNTVKIQRILTPRNKVSRASCLVHRKLKIFECPKTFGFEGFSNLNIQNSIEDVIKWKNMQLFWIIFL